MKNSKNRDMGTNAHGGKKRKKSLAGFAAATGAVFGAGMVVPGNTVYASELDSANSESMESELESGASASQ